MKECIYSFSFPWEIQELWWDQVYASLNYFGIISSLLSILSPQRLHIDLLSTLKKKQSILTQFVSIVLTKVDFLSGPRCKQLLKLKSIMLLKMTHLLEICFWMYVQMKHAIDLWIITSPIFLAIMILNMKMSILVKMASNMWAKKIWWKLEVCY